MHIRICECQVTYYSRQEHENQNLRKQYKYGKVKIGTYGNDTNMGKEIDDQVSLDQASSSKVREGKVCRD